MILSIKNLKNWALQGDSWVYRILFSDWLKISVWGIPPRFGEIFDFISGWRVWLGDFYSELFKEYFNRIPL